MFEGFTKEIQNFDYQNSTFETLMAAYRHNELSHLNAILRCKPDLLNVMDTYDKSVLHYAAEDGNCEALQLLLEFEPDLTNYEEALGKALERGHWKAAYLLQKNRPKMIKILVAALYGHKKKITLFFLIIGLALASYSFIPGVKNRVHSVLKR